ncbi:VOC family protein [Paenibacillus sp. IB182496]|uniref:VOC family protein n=1 Tax=Paenibacillus sabuli TaxID=2772509 RepID=A0A927BRC2_9BACL|nr:VOC family protein [Paenibacillus sabuli]MBD2844340.1 VOC family protein [Paenibacillus sabuli]
MSGDGGKVSRTTRVGAALEQRGAGPAAGAVPHPVRSAHAGTEMGAVHLRVASAERAERFYCEIVGLRVLNRYGGAVRLTADGIHPLLVLEERPGAKRAPQQRCSGLYHFALLVPERRDLALVLRHLLQAGVGVGSADHDVSEALYLSDPDGNGIEIYWDYPREHWRRLPDGSIYMDADPLDSHGLLQLAEQDTWSGLPQGTVIGHVHLHVKRLDEAEAFYCGVLGFRPTLRYGAGALFIAAGGYHHHIGLNIWAGVDAPSPPADAAGLLHYTIVCPDPQRIEAILAWLDARGERYETRGDGWYFCDPSGIGIRLTTCPVL